ncbi:hypothetical protein GZ77_26100 [Endozoicomonas montiporae]|uniref:Phage head-tail adapter protein n=1 Tax=Endozoicomonas montiporae TaxID=1027273 RepID=A0A081MYL5_9GAMM|nr:hypothetical protein [Endozoicomonas montiporae]KEQ11288.1 hypothetical protein GZ77_26100 [Endozoicomonas montiporae]
MNRFAQIVRRALILTWDTDALVTPEQGEPFHVEGIFNNPRTDIETKARRGETNVGSVFQERSPVLTVDSKHCEGISKKWTIKINDRVYFVARWHDDGMGLTELWLAENQEGAGNGNGLPWAQQ